MPVTLIRSSWSSGSLVFHESTSNAPSSTYDVLTLGTGAVKVGGTAQDVDFQVYGTGSLSAIIDIGAATFVIDGIATTLKNPLTVGVDDTGWDVRFYGATAANSLLWDESGDDLILEGTATQLAVEGTTESTSTTTGSLRTAGGLACVGDFYAGDDIFLTSGAVLNFAAGDVTFTHAAGKLTMGGDGAVELDLDGASMDVSLPAGCVDKADLASEIYTIEHITLTGNTNDFDNETIKLTELWSAGTVVKVAYFTNAALGTSLGIDILDGATDGSGTDVIDSCSDNLNGSDVNDLTTPYALSAGDFINVKFDDVTNDVSFTIDIQVKVPVGAAT